MNDGLLQPDGKTSSMRAAMLLCVCTACAISVIVVAANILTKAPIDSNVPWLIGGLLSAGFGGKVLQKEK